jgi:DNA-binding MarR family transcriptional regulator
VARSSVSPTSPAQIGFLLGRAYYSYVGLLDRLLEETGLDQHLKPGMGSLLFALFRQDDRTIGQLAEELQLARSTMTGMVSRMRKARLIQTAADSGDGRAVRIRLTPLARSLEARCRRLAHRVEQMLCRNLSPNEQSALRDGLSIVVRTINGELEPLTASKSAV